MSKGIICTHPEDCDFPRCKANEAAELRSELEAWKLTAHRRFDEITALSARLGRAFMMCRELMAEDAYKLFREEMDKIAVTQKGPC
jgi:hypothetical protein